MVLFVTVLITSNIASSAKIVDWGFSILGVRIMYDAGNEEVIFASISYRVVNFLKKADSEDFYDIGTRFSPI
jgi:hypothetical protein